MTVLMLVLFLLLAGGCLSRPTWEESTPPPGPPEILSEGEGGGHQWEQEDWEAEEELARLENELASLPGLEITAVVSRSPFEEWEEEGNNTLEDVGERKVAFGNNGNAGKDGNPLVVESDSTSLLLLSWWQVLLLLLACLLGCCLCSYLSGCCFLTVDCCSDPYWCCCSCLQPCVSPLKPPPHLSHSLSRKETHLSTTYSLNESSTAPRRSIERETVSSQKERGSSRSVRDSTPVTLADETLASPLMANTLESSTTLPTSTLQSGKSVRNYKRSASAGKPGLSESQPHVYPEEGGSYSSWLHLIGRSSKRYTVTEPRKQRKANNNNTVYRQNTRYRHIPDSRNSAVIPTKISKRMSTASNFNGRPPISKRSRSAETVDSLEDGPAPLLEGSRSERAIGRSRLSANLATLEAGRSERSLGSAGCRARRTSGGRSTPVTCPTAPLLPEYNLRTFEKSLLKSKETTL